MHLERCRDDNSARLGYCAKLLPHARPSTIAALRKASQLLIVLYACRLSRRRKMPTGYNSQGNAYNTPGGSNSNSGSSYHYSNSNGSYYYANDNGSTYYQPPSGGTPVYTPPSGNK